jgi:hypothetical protein
MKSLLACLAIFLFTVACYANRPKDEDYIEVTVAVAVSDNRQAEMEQDRAIVVNAQGIDSPANPIAASVNPKAKVALLNVKTNADGKLIAAEVVKVRLKRIK